MDVIENLTLGFSAALTLNNLLYAVLGCFLGTLVGVLPGIGALATLGILLPFTYGMEPLTALIMLSAIYYGTQYGGSTTAILVKLPGETSSVVTMIDGHEMARQGRAGVALGTAALSSFFAGCVGTIIIAAFAVPLSAMAFRFGPAEYFSLMLVGLIGAVVLDSVSFLRSLGMIVVGLVLALVGTDINSGVLRFTFGQPILWDGIDFIIVAVGIFAFSEVIGTLEAKEKREAAATKVTRLLPNRAEFRRLIPATLRGTSIGSIVGVLPGAGASIASFLAYAMERTVSKHPQEFGRGAIEGVAGPEAANNAAAQTSFVPTLSLGVPGSASMALILGALTIHNITPGPGVISSNPVLFWGLIASMWIGNLILVILNMPLIGIWVRLLRVPYHLLFPAILLFSSIGIYSVRNNASDILLAAAFGVVGYMFRKFRCDPAPLMLGLVLGPFLEENFRRTMVVSNGDFSVFVSRPISLVLLLLASGMLVAALLPAVRRLSKKLPTED